jgi:hypothetical protein
MMRIEMWSTRGVAPGLAPPGFRGSQSIGGDTQTPWS